MIAGVLASLVHERTYVLHQRKRQTHPRALALWGASLRDLFIPQRVPVGLQVVDLMDRGAE